MDITAFAFLPTIAFAHKFSAESYHGRLTKRADKIEISIITQGELEITQNGKKFIAVSGDIICNDYLSPLHIDTEKPHEHHTVCFSFDTSANPPNLPLIISTADFASCSFLIDKIIRTYFIEPQNQLKLSGLFLQLLGELESKTTRTPARFSPSEMLYVEKTKNYIREHICEPIIQKDIAANLGVSAQYLCSVFKKVEGRTILRFVNEIKLGHIKNMMQIKRVSLAQASAQLGFSDPNYVSKLYKKYYNEPITCVIKTSK